MIDAFHDVYRNRRILITGHTGFKGSWLSLWLSELGAKVYGYSLKPNTEPSLFQTLGLEKKLTGHVLGDVRDFDAIDNTINDIAPEFIFHLAAQPLVRLSYREPLATFATNVMGTLHVLEAARNSKRARVVINVTSDKCYENREWAYGYRESDPMGGYDPYSSSKGCSELVTAAYRNSFYNPQEYGKTHHVSIASVRAGNVIGGGDWADDRLIPDCIRALTREESIMIRNPIATRPWQHVLEPLSGYLWLGALMYGDHEKYSQSWNFGPDDDSIISVEAIVKESIKLWGAGQYEVNPGPGPHEASLLKLDISKSRFYLEWEPVLSIEQTLKNTIEWYKTYYSSKANMIDYTIAQIKNYCQNAIQKGLPWAKA